MHSRPTLGIALLLASALAGCVPAPAPEPVAPGDLPEDARFSPIGNVGNVY